MKSLSIVIFVLLSFAAVGQTITDPSQFPVEAAPDNTNFEFYTRKTGTNKKATMNGVRLYMAPQVSQSQLVYVPTPTGNTTSLNRFVTDVNGQKWFIDAVGNATPIVDEIQWGYLTVNTSVGSPSFTVTGSVPANLANVLVERGGLVYKVGAPGCSDCNVVYNSSTQTFTFFRAVASGESVKVRVPIF